MDITQDWKPVIIRSKNRDKKKILHEAKIDGNLTTEKKFNAGKNSQHATINSKKLEEESYDIPKISTDLKIQIQQARQKKNWTQKELANASNLLETTIRDYELGKGIPNNQDLMKMSKVLGVKLNK